MRRPLGPAVDLFAHVGTVVGVLRADRLPTPEVPRRPLVDERLALVGEAEEATHQLEDGVVQVPVHPVVHHQEKPHLVAHPAQLVGQFAPRPARGRQGRHVHHRDLPERFRCHAPDSTDRRPTCGRVEPSEDGLRLVRYFFSNINSLSYSHPVDKLLTIPSTTTPRRVHPRTPSTGRFGGVGRTRWRG